MSVSQPVNNNNIFSLIKPLTNALRCTFTCYAIETILTTNRTDSLQYTALIAAYNAYPPYGARTRYLSLSMPVVIQCAISPFVCITHVCISNDHSMLSWMKEEGDANGLCYRTVSLN